MSGLTTIQNWLYTNKFGEIQSISPVSGGCINETVVICLDNGKTIFCKQHENPPHYFFAAEAAGLNALRKACRLKVPEVLHVGQEFLLLEDLGSGQTATDYWSDLGEGLAELHQHKKPAFGFDADNFCGLTPQANPVTSEGYDFFANHRLLALGRKAVDSGSLPVNDMKTIESIADNLARWIPPQAARLIHGDLWSGNVHADKMGLPALIDPACYWGWAEAELAMTTLFGGFHRDFYAAYESASEIDLEWRDRAALYNLYHLLNHLLLFGGGYLGQVRAVIARYS